MAGPAKVRGYTVGYSENVTFSDCEKSCIENEKCQSFTHISTTNKCYFKDKELDRCDPIIRTNPSFYSAYKICEKGEPLKGNLYFRSFLRNFYCPFAISNLKSFN